MCVSITKNKEDDRKCTGYNFSFIRRLSTCPIAENVLYSCLNLFLSLVIKTFYTEAVNSFNT